MRKKTAKPSARKPKSLRKQSSKKSIVRIVKKKTVKKQFPSSPAVPVMSYAVQKEGEAIERAKFNSAQTVTVPRVTPLETYNLPVRYGDNRIVLLARDPWWMYTYWDISESKVNEVVASIPVHERENLRWALRVYDVSGLSDFSGSNANSFFDIDINYEANNWYINVNKPECSWCVEIGFKNPAGKFFVVARSNIMKTPYFGISSVIDEEWALPDEEYYKVLGVYDLGKSSLERKKRFEEIMKHQVSSPLASWGMSSLFSERERPQDKFFLEVWTELILYGRTEHDAHVTVEGKPITLRADGTFSLRYALPVGDYQFEVAATSKSKKHRLKKTPAVKRFDK